MVKGGRGEQDWISQIVLEIFPEIFFGILHSDFLRFFLERKLPEITVWWRGVEESKTGTARLSLKFFLRIFFWYFTFRFPEIFP